MHSDTPSMVLRADDVAAALGYRTTASFYNRRAALEAAGFPPRLPGLGTWSRAAVERWIANNGETYAPAASAPAGRNPLEEAYS